MQNQKPQGMLVTLTDGRKGIVLHNSVPKNAEWAIHIVTDHSTLQFVTNTEGAPLIEYRGPGAISMDGYTDGYMQDYPDPSVDEQ